MNFLIEIFGAYGGLLHTAIVEDETELSALGHATKSWAERGGRTDKCTGFSVRRVSSYAVLLIHEGP